MYEQAVSSNPLYPYILNIFLPTLPARRSEIPLNDWLQRHAQNVVKVPLRYAVNSARACTVGGSCLVPCGITSGNLTYLLKLAIYRLFSRVMLVLTEGTPHGKWQSLDSLSDVGVRKWVLYTPVAIERQRT